MISLPSIDGSIPAPRQLCQARGAVADDSGRRYDLAGKSRDDFVRREDLCAEIGSRIAGGVSRPAKGQDVTRR